MNQQPRGLQRQVRALYRALLESQLHFDEFKALLARYPRVRGASDEPEPAARVRAEVNARISGWLDGDFEGLSVVEVLQWKAIVLDEDLENSDHERDEQDDGRGVLPAEQQAG